MTDVKPIVAVNRAVFKNEEQLERACSDLQDAGYVVVRHYAYNDLCPPVQFPTGVAVPQQFPTTLKIANTEVLEVAKELYNLVNAPLLGQDEAWHEESVRVCTKYRALLKSL